MFRPRFKHTSRAFYIKEEYLGLEQLPCTCPNPHSLASYLGDGVRISMVGILLALSVSQDLIQRLYGGLLQSVSFPDSSAKYFSPEYRRKDSM